MHEIQPEGAGVQSKDYAGIDVGACAKHYMSRAIGRCDDCHALWCNDCLVPPVRRRQPTRCIQCALIAAGVRAPGAKPGGIKDMGRNRKRPTRLF